MAGIRKKYTIDGRIKAQEDLVFKTKAKYDEYVAELDRLITKKKEMDAKTIMEAFEKSSRTLEEVLDFLGQSPKKGFEEPKMDFESDDNE